MLNLKSLKNTLTESQITEALTRLGSGPPVLSNGALIFDTICHNLPSCGSRKLYYYIDSKIFKCYTGCSDCFDIFELISRSFNNRNIHLSIQDSMYWLYKNSEIFFIDNKDDFKKYDSDTIISEKEIAIYDTTELDRLNFFIIQDWYDQGIQVETMMKYNIKYNPVSCCIIIPHLNSDGHLIGIRQRILIADEEQYGKYRAAYINSKSFPHPLSYNLYGLNFNKDSIIKLKKAIIFEGEKSILLMDKYPDSCAVACCGSSISNYQIKLLLDLGVEEVIIAFDKEFLEINDEMFIKNVKNLQNISKRFSDRVVISFIFDKWNKLKLKDSPIERGLDTFNFLLSNRFTLELEKNNEI